MSLGIVIGKVEAVLLSNEWYEIEPGSFDLDAYEYLDIDDPDAHLLHGGGRSGVCATGFEFRCLGTDSVIAGPLTAIEAVRYQQR